MRAEKAIIRPWPRLLNVETAADYLGVSRRTIEEWFYEGKINNHHLPGIRGRKTLEKVVFDRVELERFAKLQPEK